jgi:hypothetical protein
MSIKDTFVHGADGHLYRLKSAGRSKAGARFGTPVNGYIYGMYLGENEVRASPCLGTLSWADPGWDAYRSH